MKVTAVGLPNRNVGQINYPFIHSVAVQSALPPLFSLVSTLLLSLSLFCFVCLFDIFLSNLPGQLVCAVSFLRSATARGKLGILGRVVQNWVKITQG